jgi:hypothetical protein
MISCSYKLAGCVPIGRHDRTGGDVLPAEESATLLLWACPRLIGWSRTINWIFSPVVGNRRYPGDLWGLDSRGQLLVVETKLDRSGRAQNPLEDFVPYATSPSSVQLWDADCLRRRWRAYLNNERLFMRRYSTSLPRDNPFSGTFPGVLPYSRHRDTIRRWQVLYQDRILPRFQSGRYERAVERSLRIRQDEANPPPIFGGVIAAIGSRIPRLSMRGEADLQTLERLVGHNRVFLQALQVATDGSAGITVRSWSMRRTTPANIGMEPTAPARSSAAAHRRR